MPNKSNDLYYSLFYNLEDHILGLSNDNLGKKHVCSVLIVFLLLLALSKASETLGDSRVTRQEESRSPSYHWT